MSGLFLISDVDDAAQEALLTLSSRISRLQALAAFSGRLFRLVQRRCRRLGCKALNFDPYDEEKLENWLAVHNNKSLRLELIGALEALPKHYRDVILLRDFKELSIKEMAERLEWTTAAVKSRLHRARQFTREYLLD